MRLSFSTNAFSRCSVIEAVKSVSSIGYRGVELLADEPHLYAEKVSREDLSELAELLDRLSLEAANINANTAVGYYGRTFWEPLFEPSIANPDPDARRWRIQYTEQCLEMAQFLGAPCISVTSGRPVPGISLSESMSLLRSSLEELLTFAEQISVNIGIEYEPGLLVENCAELASLIRDMSSPRLGANLDLGHSHVAGEEPSEVIDALDGRIFHLHLEDISGGKHYHLIPGDGDIDFARLFELLRSAGYEGFATVELYTYPDNPDRAARQAFEFLRGL